MHVPEKLFIQLDPIRRRARRLIEAPIVGMRGDERQPAVGRHPIELALPHVDRRLLEREQERGSLRQGVWQLDVTAAGGPMAPGRERRLRAVPPWLARTCGT